MHQQTVSDPSKQELIDWHNRTVRLMSERFGTKKSHRPKKLPPAVATPAAAAAPRCEDDQLKSGANPMAAGLVEADPAPKVVETFSPIAKLSAEQRAPPKPSAAAAPPRTPSVKDELAALDRIKLLLLEASDEPSSVDSRRAAAVRRYGDLFTTSWPAARKALDGLAELDGMDTLKEKILLSVMVLCYKDCLARRAKMEGSVAEAVTAQSKVVTSPAGDDDLEKAFLLFLRTNSDEYSYEPTVQDVIDRLSHTLYEYPLCTCKELRRFADECARVAWDLCTVCRAISSCPWVNCDDSEFSETRHVRKDGSEYTSVKIASCIWPCLLDGAAETCLYKGVVITR